MAKGATYDILPKMKILKAGTLLRTLEDIQGTNAVGIHADDEDHEFGDEEVLIPTGTTCMFVEDWQFTGSDGKVPVSAWVRCRLIAGDKIIYYTLLCERKQIWDFETYRRKQRIIQAAIDKTFVILKEGTNET